MAIVVSRVAPLLAPGSPAAVTGIATGDLTPGETYYYTITAVTATNWGLDGVPSAEVSAVADANGSIDLSWAAVGGAAAYRVWRTPVSGYYDVDYNGGADYDRDVNPMFLRDGKIYTGANYTTTGTSLIDLGSVTERPAGYAYYRWWHNKSLNPYGQGTITVTGGTSGDEASFEDIYAHAVANSYDTTTFQKLYGGAVGERAFFCYDYLVLEDYFSEASATITMCDRIRCNTGTYRFGVLHAYGYGYNGVMFVVRNHAGRQLRSVYRFENTLLYGCRIIRDWGNSQPENDNTPTSISSDTGYIAVYDDCELTDCEISGINWQQLYTYGTSGVVMRRASFVRNSRGFNLISDQSATVFDRVTVDPYVYALTGRGGTLRDCTLSSGTANMWRFFSVTGEVRTLIDCDFPIGHGLPGSCTNGGTAINNKMVIGWSLNVKVTDKESNPIEDVDVVLVDIFDARLDLATDASGDIVEQELTEAEYTKVPDGLGLFNTTTEFGPYTLTISKPGYRTYRTLFALDSPKELLVKLTRSPFVN